MYQQLQQFFIFFKCFTTITKQVIQLILIMLVGIDICLWDGLHVGGNWSTRGNPPV